MIRIESIQIKIIHIKKIKKDLDKNDSDKNDSDKMIHIKITQMLELFLMTLNPKEKGSFAS